MWLTNLYLDINNPNQQICQKCITIAFEVGQMNTVLEQKILAEMFGEEND